MSDTARPGSRPFRCFEEWVEALGLIVVAQKRLWQQRDLTDPVFRAVLSRLNDLEESYESREPYTPPSTRTDMP